ncbi:UNVERIFIED_CONTAM: hypothetical protein FKN15_040242 [Acipenser sinensis]
MKTQTLLLPYQTGNVAATVSTPAFSSHSGTLTTQVFPTQIESVVNPILLSQMAEVSNQMLPLQQEHGANPLLSLQMGSGLNLSLLSHKGHSSELPIHLQALASQVSSQITATNPVLSPQRPRGNTNLVVNSQASVINPALFSEMQSSANLILPSEAESNCLPVLPSRLENSTDPILTPRLTDGTNSVMSHHVDSNAHSVHPAQVQKSADSLLPLQIDCGSHIGAPPTQGENYSTYSTMGSNNNPHVPSQVDNVTNIVLSQVDPSNPNLPSNMEGLSNALLPSLMDRATHPLLPSNLESFKNAGEPATGKVKKPKGPKPKVPKPKVEKLKVEKPKKQPKPEVKKQKKPAANTSESSHSYSPYRPYRCVHQGCFAAFTIQQNLILHYRAVHQSDLPTFEQDNEEESAEIKEDLVEEMNQITEFRLLSDMNLGRFRCDQPECKASFTAFWKYIGHLEVDHEPEKLINNDGEEGVFRCDCEGCDCVYATRSNLLRHLFRKHKDSHKSHLIRPRKKMDSQESCSVNGDPSKKSKSAGGKGDNEKENWQDNKKSKISSAERKKKKNDANKTVWIKSKKTPSLKTNDEALAMCTKKFSLQYPCMIKGCLSVVRSERNMFRHYKTHRLTDAFLLQQGSDFIICKQRSLPLKKSKSTGDDGEKSQEDQSENSEEDLADTYPELSETESSRLTSEKDEVAEHSKPFKKKRSAHECSVSKPVWRRKRTIRQAFPDSVSLIKRKRGRPPLKRKSKEAVQIRIKNRRVRKLKPVLYNQSSPCSGSESATSSCTVPVQKEQQHNNIDFSTFKPMGFEVSFLKFLEESADQPKRKAKENPFSEIASKRKTSFPPKSGSLGCSKSDLHIRTSGCHNLIDFQNPLNLQSVENVKIVLDRTFIEGAELLLKQLQEMRPAVVLEKW